MELNELEKVSLKLRVANMCFDLCKEDKSADYYVGVKDLASKIYAEIEKL